MQTIIATFDDQTTAQSAVDQLLAQGFQRGNVHLESASLVAHTGPSPEPEVGEGHGAMAKVGAFFSHLFGSDPDANPGHYSEAVRRGSTVVAVDAATDAEVSRATTLMEGLGSVDVEERAAQWRSRGWTGFDPTSNALSADDEDYANQSIPVVQEQIQVGKRQVNTGGLRVIKRITETPVSEVVKLREERATIERHPVDRAATEGDFSNFKEGTLEMRERSEEAVVGKTARVVEEVRIAKDVTERPETVSDTVRRTDVEVERLTGDKSALDVTGEPARKI